MVNRMPESLQTTLANFLADNRLSNKALADSTGISYPTILAIVKKGSVPRRVEHREKLREVMKISHEEWGAIMARSGKGRSPAPDGGPQTLKQMVTQKLFANEYTEQSFADYSGIPYATISGITRKGAIPRAETLTQITELLGLDDAKVKAAVNASRTLRDGQKPLPTLDDVPALAELVARHLAAAGETLGAFSKKLKVGYLTASRLITKGIKNPNEPDLEKRLSEALNVSPNVIASSIERSQKLGEQGLGLPSMYMRGNNPIPEDASPLQKSLIGLMNREGLTIKAMAERSDLSQLTMAKFIKGTSAPSRSGTHTKLQKLLNLDQQSYLSLLSAHAHESSHAFVFDEAPVIDEEAEELVRHYQRLDETQREDAMNYIINLLSSDEE